MAIASIGVGKDYTTLEAWEATLPAVLLEDEIAECYGAGVVVNDGGRGPDISGVTTAADKRIIIRAATGEETTFKRGTGPVLQSNFGSSWPAIAVRNGCDHLVVEGLEFEVGAIYAPCCADFRSVAAADSKHTITNCYSYAVNAGDIWSNSWVASTPVSVWELFNCLSTVGSKFDHANITTINCTTLRGLSPVANVETGSRYGVAKQTFVAYFGPTSGWRDYLQPHVLSVDMASYDTSGSAGLQSLDPYAQYTDIANEDWAFKAGNSLEAAGVGGVDIGFVLPVVGGGSAALIINDGDSLHSADQIPIEHFQSLLVTISAHIQTADIVPIAQLQTLTINESIHSHATDTVGVGQFLSLVPNEILHSHSLGNVSLIQGQGLTVNTIQHSLMSDVIAIEQLQSVIAFNSTHGLSSDLAGLFVPSGYGPSPGRTHNAERTNRELSAADSGRKISPTNNRTLRI